MAVIAFADILSTARHCIDLALWWWKAPAMPLRDSGIDRGQCQFDWFGIAEFGLSTRLSGLAGQTTRHQFLNSRVQVERNLLVNGDLHL